MASFVVSSVVAVSSPALSSMVAVLSMVAGAECFKRASAPLNLLVSGLGVSVFIGWGSVVLGFAQQLVSGGLVGLPCALGAGIIYICHGEARSSGFLESFETGNIRTKEGHVLGGQFST